MCIPAYRINIQCPIVHIINAGCVCVLCDVLIYTGIIARKEGEPGNEVRFTI